MSEHSRHGEEDEPIRLEHDDVITRLDAYRRKTGTATAEIVDLTLAEEDVIVIPDEDDPRND